MLVTDFDFALPEDLIAQTAAPRGQSRLLALDRAHWIVRTPRDCRPPGVLATRRCPRRQRHARLCRAAAGSSGTQRWGSRVPTAESAAPSYPAPSFQLRAQIAVSSGLSVTMWGPVGSGGVGCPDASGPEAQTGSRGQVRRRRRRADGGSARATFPGTPHDPSVVGIGSERHGAGGRDRPRAAAALHQARGHGCRWRALSDGVCARAWFGGRADRGAALHRVAAGGAGRSRCRARLDHAARRLRHVQAGQGRPRRGSRRRSRDLRDH